MRPPNRSPGRQRFAVRIAGWAFTGYVFAVGGLGMWVQNRIMFHSEFAIRTAERPYATRIKGRTYFVGRRDYWMNALLIYAFVGPFVLLAAFAVPQEQRDV